MLKNIILLLVLLGLAFSQIREERMKLEANIPSSVRNNFFDDYFITDNPNSSPHPSFYDIVQYSYDGKFATAACDFNDNSVHISFYTFEGLLIKKTVIQTGNIDFCQVSISDTGNPGKVFVAYVDQGLFSLNIFGAVVEETGNVASTNIIFDHGFLGQFAFICPQSERSGTNMYITVNTFSFATGGIRAYRMIDVSQLGTAAIAPGQIFSDGYTNHYNFDAMDIISQGNGGAVFVWNENHFYIGSPNPSTYQVFMQEVDPSGNLVGSPQEIVWTFDSSEDVFFQVSGDLVHNATNQILVAFDHGQKTVFTADTSDTIVVSRYEIGNPVFRCQHEVNLPGYYDLLTPDVVSFSENQGYLIFQATHDFRQNTFAVEINVQDCTPVGEPWPLHIDQFESYFPRGILLSENFYDNFALVSQSFDATEGGNQSFRLELSPYEHCIERDGRDCTECTLGYFVDKYNGKCLLRWVQEITVIDGIFAPVEDHIIYHPKSPFELLPEFFFDLEGYPENDPDYALSDIIQYSEDGKFAVAATVIGVYRGFFLAFYSFEGQLINRVYVDTFDISGYYLIADMGVCVTNTYVNDEVFVSFTAKRDNQNRVDVLGGIIGEDGTIRRSQGQFLTILESGPGKKIKRFAKFPQCVTSGKYVYVSVNAEKWQGPNVNKIIGNAVDIQGFLADIHLNAGATTNGFRINDGGEFAMQEVEELISFGEGKAIQIYHNGYDLWMTKLENGWKSGNSQHYTPPTGLYTGSHIINGARIPNTNQFMIVVHDEVFDDFLYVARFDYDNASFATPVAFASVFYGNIFTGFQFVRRPNIIPVTSELAYLSFVAFDQEGEREQIMISVDPTDCQVTDHDDSYIYSFHEKLEGIFQNHALLNQYGNLAIASTIRGDDLGYQYTQLMPIKGFPNCEIVGQGYCQQCITGAYFNIYGQCILLTDNNTYIDRAESQILRTALLVLVALFGIILV